MNNFKKLGVTLPVILAAAVASGGVVTMGAMTGIASTAGAIGDTVEVQFEGVFELPKKSADTPAAFVKAYWDSGNDEVTTTSAGNTLIGVFVQAYAASTTVADVRLNGVSV